MRVRVRVQDGNLEFKPSRVCRHPTHGSESGGAIRAEEAGVAVHPTVPELVQRTQAGDRAAFDALYHLHVHRVYAICLRMAANRPEAERLTQEAFVRLWQRIGSFRGESEFTSWLYRLTVNVVFEDGRSERRRRARVETVEDLSAVDHGVAADASGTEQRIELEAAIAALPPGARQALVLHDIEGYKHEEIARMNGTTAGSVKAQLHRARKLLRERLDR